MRWMRTTVSGTGRLDRQNEGRTAEQDRKGQKYQRRDSTGNAVKVAKGHGAGSQFIDPWTRMSQGGRIASPYRRVDTERSWTNERIDVPRTYSCARPTVITGRH